MSPSSTHVKHLRFHLNKRKNWSLCPAQSQREVAAIYWRSSFQARLNSRITLGFCHILTLEKGRFVIRSYTVFRESMKGKDHMWGNIPPKKAWEVSQWLRPLVFTGTHVWLPESTRWLMAPTVPVPVTLKPYPDLRRHQTYLYHTYINPREKLICIE